jgi:hypothetical protein
VIDSPLPRDLEEVKQISNFFLFKRPTKDINLAKRKKGILF